ncbi:MAG: hypothetical protein NC218_00665 [Acetobacter sp.]|nr:hypothetical protein [Acetobacter sp.]
MLIIWKGKQMVDYRNERDTLTTGDVRDDYSTTYNNGHYDCECCHCKKIFMMLVLLILAFIAGIMVGSCAHGRYADNYYDGMTYAQREALNNPRRFHRGMQQITPNTPARRANRAYTAPQAGGFVMEVDEID